MGKVINILDEIYKSLRFVLKDLVVFPGTNLIPALRWSLLILAITIVCDLLKIPCFLGWQGVLLAVVVLSVIAAISRFTIKDIIFEGDEESEQSELSGESGVDQLHEEDSEM